MNADRRKNVTQVASWAFCSAMLTGLVHVLMISSRHFLQNEFTWAARDYVWMTPLGYALVLAPVATVLIVAGVVTPKLISPRLIAFVFGFLGSLFVLFYFPRIHSLASLALAAGVGVRVAMWAGRRGERAFPGRVGLVIAVTLATIGAANTLERRLNERLALSSVKPASSQSPNVLLIILDTVRAANMGFLGYYRATTPELRELASGGTIFEQAYSTAPWTLPSHAGFFTGRLGSELSIDWFVPFDRSNPTISEAFRAEGYATAGFIANRFYTAWESGLDRGFDHYEDGHITLRQTLLSTTLFQTPMLRSIESDPSARNILNSLFRMDLRTPDLPFIERTGADRVSSDFLRWEQSRNDRPFFAFINLFEAHAPYMSPRPRRFRANPRRMDRYDAAIAHIDGVVGVLLDSLESRGVLGNTIVVITSDHGESFEEHGFRGHGKSLYRTELHVPLLISFPGSVPTGVRVRQPVSLRDLPATLADLAGIRGTSFPGVSLRQSWVDQRAAVSPVISEVKGSVRGKPNEPSSRGAMSSIIDDSTHFILNGDGVEEFYAWRVDPDENQNLANLPAFKTAVRQARTRLASELKDK